MVGTPEKADQSPASSLDSRVIHTPDHRLRVFVSSTLGELAAERWAAREAIEGLHLTPVMFELGASPHPPRDLYRAYLEQSDVFIGIYWERYGWIGPGMEVSGLEDEYLLSAPKPRLVYIKTPAAGREERLQALLERVESSSEHSYRRFSTPEELRVLIENDLAVLLSERFQQRAGSDSAPASNRSVTNVPVPLNRLIGREFELATACDLLRRSDVYLVTLVGPGGTGKSRLGLQIALDLLDDFSDGAFLVPLESLPDPALVTPTIAHTLSVPEARDPAAKPVDALIGHLRDRRMLLLLDNFEHVVAAAKDVSALLEGCPGLKALVTSRTPLRVRAEKQLPVPPLAVPVLDPALDTESLSEYAAVALFVERARNVKPDFALTGESAPVVAEICYRLDGLPLAIELAAARVRILPPRALLARLEQGLDVLQGGTSDLPERQHTMRDAIGWSYELLSGATSTLFRRLSVFADTWSLEAAEAVCAANDESPIYVLDEMERLIHSSLLVESTVADGDLRFSMLETIREYAMERLIESGEADDMRRRLAEYYLAFIERAEIELRTSDQVRWAERLEVERNNTRAVLAWCRERDVQMGVRLCGSIWRFWEMRNLMGEGRVWLEAFLADSPSETPGRTKALHGAAALAAYQADYETARRHSREALSISHRWGDQRGVATALHELALVAVFKGDYETARRLDERSLAIKRDLGEQWLIANSLGNLGLIAGYQRKYSLAHALAQESLDTYRAQDDSLGVAMAAGNLGHAAMRLGRLDEARTLQSESLQLYEQIGDVDGLLESLERFAMLAFAEGGSTCAATLFGAASRLREDGETLVPPAESAEREHAIDAIRARLDARDFESAWQAGTAMSRGEAIVLALSAA